jgi:hypothetical protein
MEPQEVVIRENRQLEEGVGRSRHGSADTVIQDYVELVRFLRTITAGDQEKQLVVMIG